MKRPWSGLNQPGMADQHVNPLLDPLIHPGLPPVRGHRVGLEHRHLEPVLREKLLHPLGDVPRSGMGGVDQHLASRRRRPVLWRWGTVLWDAQAGIAICGGIDIDSACKHPFEENVKADFYEYDVSELTSDFVASLFIRSVTLQWRTYKGTCGLRALAAILDLYAGKQWSDAGACCSSGASDPTVGTFDSEES